MTRTDLERMYQQLYQSALRHLSFRVDFVSPTQAADWLTRNLNNRPLSVGTVNRYVHYIRTGQWRVNGEPVILDPADHLLDGQHRLTAVVEAGVGVPFGVIRGVDKEAFKTLDQGKGRSWADTLSVIGEKNAAVLASALNWLHRYETDTMKAKPVRLSNMDLIRLLDEFPTMRDSVAYVTPRCQRGIHPPGPFTFLHFACLRKHPDRQDFFEQVLTAVGLENDSPALRLYRRLQARKRGVDTGSQAPRNTLALIAMTIKAWNATVLNRPLGVVKWTEEEDFPTIV